MSERAAENPGIPKEGAGVQSEAPAAPADAPSPPAGPIPPAPQPIPPTAPAPRRRASLAVVATVAAAVYAWLASTTTPFTLPADVTTAVPLLGMVAVVTLQRVRPRSAVWRRLPADRPPDGGTAAPWLFLLLLLVIPEVASLLAGARSSHPTISSLTDTVFRWHAAKAAVYFLWLWLCWYFVRR